MCMPTSVSEDVASDSTVPEPTAPKSTEEVVTESPEHLDDPFDLDGTSADQKPPLVTIATCDQPREDPTAELLRYHQKFGHVPMSRLQAMAEQGTIPKRLAKCPMPVCGSCVYGKATKRAKQTKTQHSIQPLKPVHAPGDCVSVDILTSSTPGLIAQMSGGLTKQRYLHACVFVDHFSDLSYVHLLKTQQGEEVIEAKEAYEAYADSFGVRMKH